MRSYEYENVGKQRRMSVPDIVYAEERRPQPFVKIRVIRGPILLRTTDERCTNWRFGNSCGYGHILWCPWRCTYEDACMGKVAYIPENPLFLTARAPEGALLH